MATRPGAVVGVRGWRERALQTLSFEAGGLLVIAPSYAWVAGATAGESLAVLAALSVTVMAWAAAFNTVFDVVECRCFDRVASDRPSALRVLHAVLLETTAMLASVPVLVWMTGLGWWAALGLDLSLTLAYMAYACVFHKAYDRLRPVR